MPEEPPATPPVTVYDFDVPGETGEVIVAGSRDPYGPVTDPSAAGVASAFEPDPTGGPFVAGDDDAIDLPPTSTEPAYDAVVAHRPSETEPLRVVGDGAYNRTVDQWGADDRPYGGVLRYDGPQEQVPAATSPAPAYDGVVAPPADQAGGVPRRRFDSVGAVWDEVASWPWRDALGMVGEMNEAGRSGREKAVAGAFERSGATPEEARTRATEYLDTAGELGYSLGAAIAGGVVKIGPKPGRRIHEYGISQKLARTGVQRHEILQHAWLERHGFATTRGIGRSRFNTVIELTPAQHRRINALQRAAGLHDPSRLAAMSAVQVIDQNLAILAKVGVSKTEIRMIAKDVIEMLPALGAKAFGG